MRLINFRNLVFTSCLLALLISIDMHKQESLPGEELNLTGTWTTTGHELKNCNAVDLDREPINSLKNSDPEISIIQKGKQLMIADRLFLQDRGTISNRDVSLLIYKNRSDRKSVSNFTGKVSDDGNTIVGQISCQNSTNLVTTAGDFILTRKLSEITLDRATTTDNRSITLNYTINNAFDKHQFDRDINIEIYRASSSDINDSNSKLKIWEEKIKPNKMNTLISINPNKIKYQVKLNIKKELKPDTSFPYVIAIATYNGKKSSTYFRKWLLGAIAHGFNPYDSDSNRLTRGSHKLRSMMRVFHPKKLLIPRWETSMANSLKTIDKYDDTISFDWTETCGLKKPNTAVLAGVELGDRVLAWMSQHHQHPGDTIDIHLIGHSRGTVVVSQALKHLMPTLQDKHFGSYIHLTLLDPHPANNYLENKWASFGTQPLKMGLNDKNLSITINNHKVFKYMYRKTKDFQEAVRDPHVEIPMGVNKIDVWFQNTEADSLIGTQKLINLWGLTSENVIRNKSNTPIALYDLTTKQKPGNGHGEIPKRYAEFVVETGELNRTKQIR
jgi:hypothetical protein